MRLLLFLLLAVLPLNASAQNLLAAAPPGGELERAPVLLVDIRQPHEWVETGVLPGARLIPFDDPQSFLAALAPHLQENQPLVLICRSGNRTGRAGMILSQMIDNTVVSVEGGMLRLFAEGYMAARPTAAQGCMVC